MSLDHRITGVRKIGSEVKLTLEDRQDKHLPDITLLLTNPPADWQDLVCLINCEVWGSATVLMLGDKKLGNRHSYFALSLCRDWLDVVTHYMKAPEC